MSLRALAATVERAKHRRRRVPYRRHLQHYQIALHDGRLGLRLAA